MTGGAWVLVEVRAGAEHRLCTSDIIDTLERIGARHRAADPTLAHRVEPNVEPRRMYVDEP